MINVNKVSSSEEMTTIEKGIKLKKLAARQDVITQEQLKEILRRNIGEGPLKNDLLMAAPGKMHLVLKGPAQDSLLHYNFTLDNVIESLNADDRMPIGADPAPVSIKVGTNETKDFTVIEFNLQRTAYGEFKLSPVNNQTHGELRELFKQGGEMSRYAGTSEVAKVWKE